MTVEIKIKLLKRAKNEFTELSIKSKKRYKVYKVVDCGIKSLLSLLSVLIIYFSSILSDNIDNSIKTYNKEILIIKSFGIITLTLISCSSIFTFERKYIANLQVHNKCELVLPEIQNKIVKYSEIKDEKDTIREFSPDRNQIYSMRPNIFNENRTKAKDDKENIEEYIRNIFKELSTLTLISFTDKSYTKIFA